MDKTELYIKMCEKAVKIQALRNRVDSLSKDNNWETGDWYKSEWKEEPDQYCEYCEGETGPWDMTSWTFLPHLAQLQDMFHGLVVDDKPRKLCKMMWDWIAETSPPSEWSMEQLWLNLLMHKKWGLVWNGEDWEALK